MPWRTDPVGDPQLAGESALGGQPPGDLPCPDAPRDDVGGLDVGVVGVADRIDLGHVSNVAHLELM